MTRRDLIKLSILSVINYSCKKMTLVRGIRAVSSYSAEAQTFFNALTTQPTLSQKECINTFFISLKSILGTWNAANLCQIYGLLGDDSQLSSRLNLFNPGTNTATFNGSYLHQPYFGVKGDGSTVYINTNWNPATSNSSFGATDGEHMIYMNYVNSSIAAQWVCGQDGSGNTSNGIRIKLQNGLSSYNGNVISGTNYTDPNLGLGLYSCKITPGTNILKIQGITTATTSVTLGAIPSANDYCLAFNDNGSLYQPADGHVYARIWVQGLTDLQSIAICDALNTLRQSLWFASTITLGTDKYVILHAGQSNATAFHNAGYLPSYMQSAFTNVYNKDTLGNTSVYRPAYNDFYGSNGVNTSQYSTGASALYKLSTVYSKTVYYYNYSVGGTALYQGANQWNVNDNQYATTTSNGLQALLAAVGGSPKVCLWWSQWNADADGGVNAAAWQANAQALFDKYRNETGLGNNLQIFIETPASWSASNYPANSITDFKGYVNNLCNNNTNIFQKEFDTIDHKSDNNHYSDGVGAIDGGIRMADLIYSHLG